MEIEIRAKVDSLKETRKKLEALGAEFEEEIEQNDYIFKRKGEEKKVQGPGSYLLRLRKAGDKTNLTFKALTETTGVWDEHQVAIDNFEETKNILLKIGFIQALRMDKKRTKGIIDNITLCLDKVEGLGDHIEAEVISDNKGDAKRKLMDLFNKIGIKEKQIEHRGYVAILFQMQGVKFDNTG